MKINWKVRIKNKCFCLTALPALIVLLGFILKIFNIEIDVDVLTAEAESVVYAIFALLSAIGVVVDPTTEGVTDSARALTYEEPAAG